MSVTDEPLLSVDGLQTSFYTEEGEVKAVNDVSYQIDRGERFAVVGESGAGKSVTSLSLMRLIDDPGRVKGGDVTFRSTSAVATLARKFPEGVATENSPGYIHVTELRSESGAVGSDPGATVRDNPTDVATSLHDGSLHIEAGHVDVLDASEDAMRELRGNEIAMIFQDPHTALNPVYTVGEQIAEAIRKHLEMDDGAAKERAIEMLERVGIPDAEERYSDYPHEFSGGMQQRAVIAIALSCDPALIVADEPTTALDVTIEAQILDLLKELSNEEDVAVQLITHDLGVVAELCDSVMVMYAGKPVERSSVEELYYEPKHPYTVGLMSSIPRIGDDRERLDTVPGTMPDLVQLPSGCSFHPRCPYAEDACLEHEPPLVDVETGEPVEDPDPAVHSAACLEYTGELQDGVDFDVQIREDAATDGGESV
ncbi:ABC transporter ATP-binding protein [Halolamina salifodinae]|uniref:Peptide/nickel transport system ATP-binding protein n=1 Tax=Halolamina salifodinae TaxID=1202767 RepID=A0A8T4GU55_9EURY|nr:ABC transporter ATP-binding protein [Halolamina salifodinae]MBP1986577.1 peptide/nickel transport system ATP-binding protein [Halolamina salifodinae]